MIATGSMAILRRGCINMAVSRRESKRERGSGGSGALRRVLKVATESTENTDMCTGLNLRATTAPPSIARLRSAWAGQELFRGVDLDSVEPLLLECPVRTLEPGEALIGAADAALYRAKRSGRNCVVS